MSRRSSRNAAPRTTKRNDATATPGASWFTGALALMLSGATCAAAPGTTRSPTLPEAAYRQTAANAPPAPGVALFRAHCATCHSASGVAAGTAALQIKYEDRVPAALEDRTDLTREFVGYVVRNGTNVMPFFRKTELSDAEVAAIAAYLARK